MSDSGLKVTQKVNEAGLVSPALGAVPGLDVGSYSPHLRHARALRTVPR